MAIGSYIADLAALADAELIDEPSLVGARVLNGFLSRGRARWSALRARLQYLLSERATPHERVLVEAALVPRAAAIMYLPIEIGDFVDFYSSIEHAGNVGALFRPANPIADNYRYVPLGYHGRSSSIVPDGTLVPRPHGQYQTDPAAEPQFGLTTELDFELELATVVGPGNAHGVPIGIEQARNHLYGYVLLNDWSARDLQRWETVPLGPVAGKSFATSISPWLVSLDALEPFRVDNRVPDIEPLAYLQTEEPWAYDLDLTVEIQTRTMRAAGNAAHTLTRVNFRSMYWHAAQQLAHLTANGARVRPGDLHGSGTVSGTEDGTFGSLLEATFGGTRPIVLPNGEERRFLEDGDTITMRATATAGTRYIALGEVRGTIVG